VGLWRDSLLQFNQTTALMNVAAKSLWHAVAGNQKPPTSLLEVKQICSLHVHAKFVYKRRKIVLATIAC
jgi:hypothetical protein